LACALLRTVASKDYWVVPWNEEITMKKSFRVAHVLLLASMVATTSACTAVSDEDPAAVEAASEELLSVRQSELLADPSLRQRVIEFAKTRIREISRANQTRTDNVAQVAEQLRPYIDLLVRVAPARSQTETLQLLLGPWYSLWTNQEFRGNSPNLARIFQVIRQGHFYNISDSPGPGGAPFIGALRGAYAPTPDLLAIRFASNAVLPGSLAGKTGAEVATLVANIESGATPVIPVPGPIGITGQLGVLYIDENLRIANGFQPPVFTDNGVITVPGAFGLLFVLERLEGTLP
jgi:hypothetical protein